MLFQEVARYTRESGYTVTGAVGGNGLLQVTLISGGESESNGIFNRNVERSVSVVGRNTSFRNPPPVFMKSSTQHNAEAAVFIGKN